MRSRLAACAAILLVLSACGKKEEAKAPTPAAAPALTGFSHDAAVDAAGYFQPATNIIIGDYQLKQIALGAPSDFAEWEAGKREGVFGPILLEFDDLRSPTTTNEMGAEVHTVRVRVLPTAYKVTKTDLEFVGQDPALGAVAFDGSFDPTALTAAKENGSSGNTPVVLGALTLGPNTITGQKFTFWTGD